MAYDTYELSEYNGSPVELFLFRDDVAQKTWAFTTGDDAIVDGVLTYLPDVIRRTGIRQTSGQFTEGIEVRVISSSSLAQEFKAYLPARPVGLIVYRLHRKDGELERRSIFTGQVTTASFDKDGMTTLNCQHIGKATKRKVPWQVYKANCNWPLYEEGCGVLRALFATPAGAYTLSENTVISAEFAGQPDGWFTNGYIEVVATGERRFVIAHVGNTLTLNYPFFGIPAGEEMTAYAGCDRSKEMCAAKFNNIQKQLAFDYIPNENMFDTTFGPTGAGESPIPANIARRFGLNFGG